MPLNVVVTWKVLWSTLVALATVAGVIVYITWEIRKDYIDDLKNQIAVYSQAESWKLPDTLKKLNSVSELLQSQLSTADEIKKLKLEISDEATKNKVLTIELAKTNAVNAELNTSIVALKNDLSKAVAETHQFSLKEGQTIELAKNQMTFGVTTVVSSWAMGYLNNDRVEIKLAGALPVKLSVGTCFLRLIEGTATVATFSFTCPKPIENS